jgi:hypothetical protein
VTFAPPSAFLQNRDDLFFAKSRPFHACLPSRQTLTNYWDTCRGGRPAADKNAIRSFHVNVPEVELTELRGRIKATKWPERETVTDASQGVQLATI